MAINFRHQVPLIAHSAYRRHLINELCRRATCHTYGVPETSDNCTLPSCVIFHPYGLREMGDSESLPLSFIVHPYNVRQTSGAICQTHGLGETFYDCAHLSSGILTHKTCECQLITAHRYPDTHTDYERELIIMKRHRVPFSHIRHTEDNL